MTPREKLADDLHTNGYVVGRDSADYLAGMLLGSLTAAGFAVVPVEPTEAMIDAGAEARKAVWQTGPGVGMTLENQWRHAHRVELATWAAMIRAAKEGE